MPALALNPRCKGLFLYTTTDIPWTCPQSDSPERPQTPSSASESPSSSGSSHTLGRNHPSEHDQPETRARSPSYAPDTPTRSPSPYKPDTPSPWMTTLTSKPAGPSNATATTTTTTSSVRSDLGIAQRPTLPSISSLLQSTPNSPLPTPLRLPPVTTRAPPARPMHSPSPLRPARMAANPPSPGPGLLYFTARSRPSVVVQPVPRRTLGVEARTKSWVDIVQGWERDERQSEAPNREDVGMGEAGRHLDGDREDDTDPDDWAVGDGEEEEQWRCEVLSEARQCLPEDERRMEEHARRRTERMARRWCLRGGLDFGALRVRGL